MLNKNLILIGGGGHCKSVIEVAESAGYTIKGILDVPKNVGKTVLDYPIIGTDGQIKDYVHDYLFVVTVGHIKDASLRVKLHRKIEDAGGQLGTVIAHSAYVSRRVIIGEGTVIMHHAMVNADVKIGKGCIINTFSNIEHDAVIEDYCHISTGAMVNGNCKVGTGTFLGSQAVMVNGTEIAEDCVIAAGAVVRKSITYKGIYAGNPAILNKIKS